jgi:hypothetical protein
MEMILFSCCHVGTQDGFDFAMVLEMDSATCFLGKTSRDVHWRGESFSHTTKTIISGTP